MAGSGTTAPFSGLGGIAPTLVLIAGKDEGIVG
jgi:hypothetical protein